jgi:hypothetical protein
MIALDGYDMKRINAIEQSLMDAYFSQDAEDDIEEYVQKNAPEEYLSYLKDHRAASARLEAKGILA